MIRTLKVLSTTVILSLISLNVYAAFPYSMTFTVSAGDTILADHYNTANNEHINNNIPESIDDYSNSVAEMGATTDPYPAGTESQADTLDGELQRMRKKIFDLVSITNGSATKWYHDTGSDAQVHLHADTASGGTLGTSTVFSDFTNAIHSHVGTSTGGLVATPYIRLHDSKATTTNGGTFTSGAWQKRTVTEDQDTGNNVSVASSVITLEAGTYDCLIFCPAYRVGGHQARLRNTSDSTTTLLGIDSVAWNDASAPGGSNSVISGRFVIAAQKTFEIQHRAASTRSADGFGSPNSFGENEIYTVAEFWKIN